ncbi:hypothetical protein WJX72_007111 [[Myrmecia] bisecta]|uniref:Uncharacterized protein n=1 Tax=[Myrmecia] bisecta TaxID=41462 RepID=A0AAW1P5Z1_9CHLO
MNSAVTEREEDTGPLVMLKRHLTGGGTTTSEAVLECARATKLLSGKWLIASHPNMVDAAWDKVVRALADGKLGFAAKACGSSGFASRSATSPISIHCWGWMRRVSTGLA